MYIYKSYALVEIKQNMIVPIIPILFDKKHHAIRAIGLNSVLRVVLTK